MMWSNGGTFIWAWTQVGGLQPATIRHRSAGAHRTHRAFGRRLGDPTGGTDPNGERRVGADPYSPGRMLNYPVPNVNIDVGRSRRRPRSRSSSTWTTATRPATTTSLWTPSVCTLTTSRSCRRPVRRPLQRLRRNLPRQLQAAPPSLRGRGPRRHNVVAYGHIHRHADGDRNPYGADRDGDGDAHGTQTPTHGDLDAACGQAADPGPWRPCSSWPAGRLRLWAGCG